MGIMALTRIRAPTRLLRTRTMTRASVIDDFEHSGENSLKFDQGGLVVDRREIFCRSSYAKSLLSFLG